ncbi:MAG: FMN-binding negative transcriptional regulator [Proteobacteria bacterium]|nr:FMN-binding negative transcriptional regulator [Pseudomonadota bacterium]
MYLPKHFQEDRPEVLAAFIRAHPLAMLVTLDGARAEVDHVPMLLSAAEPWRLRGHVARANAVTSRAPDGTEVLVVFRGVDHYITPSWYPQKRVDGRVVPTWNYSVVHVRGRIRWSSDASELHGLVTTLTDTHESSRPAPWAVDDAPADYVAAMLRAIVGFEIEVESMVGKFKASQNRSEADRAGVASGLAAEGLDPALAAEVLRDPRT